MTRAADLPPDLMYQHEYEAKKILLQRMAREYGNVRQRTKELIVARMEMESELNLEPHESALTAGEKTLVHDKTPFNYMDWCPEGQEILSQDHPYFRAYQEANQVYLQSRSRIIENACYGNIAQMIDDILIPCAIDAVVELLVRYFFNPSPSARVQSRRFQSHTDPHEMSRKHMMTTCLLSLSCGSVII